MERATPAQSRRSLAIANELAKAGFAFVPVPVLDADDRGKMLQLLSERLERLEKEA